MRLKNLSLPLLFIFLIPFSHAFCWWENNETICDNPELPIIQEPKEEPELLTKMINNNVTILTLKTLIQEEISYTYKQLNRTTILVRPRFRTGYTNASYLAKIKLELPVKEEQQSLFGSTTPTVIYDQLRSQDLNKDYVITIPERTKQATLSIGSSSTLINLSVSSTVTKKGSMQHLCMGQNNKLYTSYLDASNDLAFSKSGNSDGTGTWNKTLLHAGTYESTGILCTKNGGGYIFGLDQAPATDPLNYVQTNNLDTFSNTTSLKAFMNLTNSVYSFHCALDSKDVAHCCATDNTGLMFYANSSNPGQEISINGKIGDDSDQCAISIGRNDCPYVVAIGTDQDDVDMWSPCMMGWGDPNRTQILGGAIFLTDRGLDFHIDDNNSAHVAFMLDSTQYYANSTPTNLFNYTTWTITNVSTSGIVGTNTGTPSLAVNNNSVMYAFGTSEAYSGIESVMYSLYNRSGTRIINQKTLRLLSSDVSFTQQRYGYNNTVMDLVRYVYFDDYSLLGLAYEANNTYYVSDALSPCECASIISNNGVSCGQNCVINSMCDLSGANIVVSGSGTFNVVAGGNLHNYAKFKTQNGCKLKVSAGGKII